MKLSVSLPAEDVEFLDDYANAQGIGSRSAVVHKALELLRASQLGASYEQAWAEWETTGGHVWDGTAGDGIG